MDGHIVMWKSAFSILLIRYHGKLYPKHIKQILITTDSSAFHEVLNSLLILHTHVVVPPSTIDPLGPRIRDDKQAAKYTYFADCLGALDGTHIAAHITEENSAPFRNRKGYISQNVLAVCTFYMQFSYILPGWEGSVHDSRVLTDALSKGFRIPSGKYYLADAGYSNRDWLLTPYRGVRYHLKETYLAAAKYSKCYIFC
jgi:hypothetical protein